MLRVSDLTKREIERAKQNHETYKMLYEKCAEHIKIRNEMGNTSTRYLVPGYLVGRPVYSHGHALRYIRDKLHRGSFTTEVIDGELLIDWGREKRRAIRKQTSRDIGDPSGGKKKSKRRRSSGGSERHRSRERGRKPIEEPLSLRLARLNLKLKQ
jgi:hypothetical protein